MSHTAAAASSSSSSSSSAANASATPVEADDDQSPEIVIQIQNVVATVHMGINIELTKLQQTLKIAEYNPARFQAVIMRIREPRTTALVFRTGKMIVTGAKKLDESEIAAKKYVGIIQKAGFPAAQFSQFTIQNITATCNCGFPISLEGFLYANAAHSTYEPELFPGLIYRMVDPKIVLLIFVSGKVVITGAKNTDNLTIAVNTIFPEIMEFRKKNIITAVRNR